MDYPKEQKEWSDGKKATYEENIHKAFYDKTYEDYLCSFTLMVKSGEVNTTDAVELDHDGYLIGQSSRPRAIMNPTKGSFGIMQALQKEIFPLIKKHIPGFIHSMTTKELLDLLKSRVKQNWVSISIDGSAFDSSQF